MVISRQFSRSIQLFLVFTVLFMVRRDLLAVNTTLWQIGIDDRSSAEFGDYAAAAGPIDLPAQVQLPKGLKGSINPFISLRYTLSSVPVNL